MELTVDDVRQIADSGDQELQKLARKWRNNRRGNLELGAEDKLNNDGLPQQACTALAGE